MKAPLIAILAGALLTACATTQYPIPTRGPMPSHAEAEAAVKRLLVSGLKDPDSLKQFRIAEPQPTAWQDGIIYGSTPRAGWLVCFEYNAKNSYGAYVGLKRDGYVFRSYPGGLYFETLVSLTARGGATC